jgi:hypothetical protein
VEGEGWVGVSSPEGGLLNSLVGVVLARGLLLGALSAGTLLVGAFQRKDLLANV